MSSAGQIHIQDEDHEDTYPQEEFQCVVCFNKLKQDESIFLQCQHVLCYDCSKGVVNKLAAKLKNDSMTYRCQGCNTKTVFDRELVESLIGSKMEESKKIKESRQSKTTKTIEKTQPSSPSEDTLFCLDCQTNCFSIDAYFAGMHKNHNVKSIPKAFPILIQNTEQLRQSIKRVADSLLDMETKYNSRKRQLLDATSNAKKVVKSTLDNIRQVLQSKEREFSRQIQAFLMSNFNEYDRKTEAIRQKLVQLQQYQDELHEKVLAVDGGLPQQTEAFTYFHSHRQEIEDSLLTMDKEMELIGRPQPVESFNFRVDNDLIMRSCQSLRRLTLCITEDSQTKRQNSCKTERDTVCPSAAKSIDEDYQNYFKKAKEQLYRKSNEVEMAMRKIAERGPKENSNPNLTLRDRSRSAKNLENSCQRQKSPSIPIPTKINESLERYKLTEQNNRAPRAQILQRDELALSASRLAKQRVNRIETLFYESISREVEPRSVV